MLEYPNLQPGSITFMWYALLRKPNRDNHVLSLLDRFSTTVDQVVVAFSSPVNLPPPGVYEDAIKNILRTL